MDNFSELGVEHAIHKVARLPAFVHDCVCRRDVRLVQGDAQGQAHMAVAHAGPSVGQFDVLAAGPRRAAAVGVEVPLRGAHQSQTAFQTSVSVHPFTKVL